MHGGRLVASALRSLHDGPLFGLCGDHVNAIFDGAFEEGIRIVDMRGEAAAAFAAEGWSLATGSPGVVCVTGGPGLAAAVPAIADASMAGVPLVVITSRLRAAEEGRGFPQDIDARAIAGGLARIVTVREAGSIVRGIGQAFAEASAQRGPVIAEVALDALLARSEHASWDAHAGTRLTGLDGTSEAANIIGGASRPVAIVGEGAFWAGAGDAVRLLAENARVPVFTVRAARGLLPDDHEYCFAQPNFLREPVRTALERADVLIVAGCELDIVLAFGGLAPQAKLVRIEADASRAHRNRVPDIAIVGDESATLATLANELKGRKDRGWLKEMRAFFDAEEQVLPSGSPVHPAALISAVAASGRGTFAVDAGALALWAMSGLPASGPGRLLTSFGTPMSTIGGGIPFALAAKLARPDEPALAVVGDGAFGYGALELDTASRHGIPITVVVGNDSAWGIVKQQMTHGYGRAVAADLASRRYDLLAEPLGAHGEHVDSADALPAALARALKSDGPAVIDVALDPEPQHPAMAFVTAMFAPEK